MLYILVLLAHCVFHDACRPYAWAVPIIYVKCAGMEDKPGYEVKLGHFNLICCFAALTDPINAIKVNKCVILFAVYCQSDTCSV